jgi:ABC-2 type transport system ATP-binding protein
MRKLGKKQLTLQLEDKLVALPAELSGQPIELTSGGDTLVYTYDSQADRTGISGLLTQLSGLGIRFADLQTRESSLEDIFVGLLRADK